MTTLESLMQAALSATEERRERALKVLRGEAMEPPARPVTGPLLMGIGAGAKFLGVSRATLWRACLAGRIQKVELFPGSYRVRREDLIGLAEGKRVPGTLVRRNRNQVRQAERKAMPDGVGGTDHDDD